MKSMNQKYIPIIHLVIQLTLIFSLILGPRLEIGVTDIWWRAVVSALLLALDFQFFRKHRIKWVLIFEFFALLYWLFFLVTRYLIIFGYFESK